VCVLVVCVYECVCVCVCVFVFLISVFFPLQELYVFVDIEEGSIIAFATLKP
jgi:hypothetical protein